MKAIPFDFNGTLFSDDAFHYKAWNRILQELTGERLTITVLNEDAREEQSADHCHDCPWS